MSITSDTFVASIPSTEEEMVAIAESVIRLNSSREYYLNTIEAFQQLAVVMQEHLDELDRRKKIKNAAAWADFNMKAKEQQRKSS